MMQVLPAREAAMSELTFSRRARATAIALVSLWMLQASILNAQTPPISGPVARGVPRQILTSRTDDQLAALLGSGARGYTRYTFEYGEGMDHARIRRWSGLLILPRTTDLGKLGPVGLPTIGGGKSTDSWYAHGDGTLSKLVIDERGASIGVMSIRGASMWLSLDMNRDGFIDFFRSISLSGREEVAAMDGDGAAFLERWRLGENRLCTLPRTKTLSTTGDRIEGRSSSPIAAAGTVPMCGETSENSGPLAGIRRDGPTPPPDPMSRICAGRSGSRTLPGGGPRADSPRGTLGAAGAAIGGTAGQPTAAESRERMAAAAARAVGDYVRDRVFIMLMKPPKDEKDPGPRDITLESEAADRSSPVFGGDGSRVGSGDQALAEVCSARARADRRWSVIGIAEAERRKTGAGDTNCDDPVTDPAAADAEKTMPKCGPDRGSQSVSEQLLEGIGARDGRQCSRFEQPGPDGTCRGGRTITGGRGQVWYGYGSLIGLVPCEGIACDPRPESR